MKRNYILTAIVLSCISAHATQQLSSEHIPSYANRFNFNMLRLGYEHIKPQAVYVGVEAWYVLGSNPDGLQLLFGQAEARMGYNFSLRPSDTLTPFVGGGYFKSFERGKKQEIGYPSLGIRYEHVFGTIFNLGLNLEGMPGFSLNNQYTSWGDPIWGIDVGLPFTWRFTKTRRWDFRFEPFFTGWYGQDREVVFGGARSAVGYRF